MPEPILDFQTVNPLSFQQSIIFLFTCKTKKVAKCKQISSLAIIWHDVTSAATWPNSSNSENSIYE